MSGFAAIRSAFGSAPALFPFLTAGLPTPADSVGLFEAMAEAGADGFEVGIPFSDPLMDGPVIMKGSEAALAAGTNRAIALDIVGEVVKRTGKPVLAMTYVNPVMQTGWTQYAADLAERGGAGIIVPDLPLQESSELAAACHAEGLGRVQFVSPTTTDAQIGRVAAANPAFIYGVTDMGVTGERTSISPHVVFLSERVRAQTDVPLVLGVGISTPEQAAAVKNLADGVIIGTVLVRKVLEAENAAAAAVALKSTVAEFKAALG
ncbi:MAG: tryptophan synthase subunit alpha [Acidimicrobiia bacterium]